MKILVNLVGLSHHNVGNGLHSYKPVYKSLFDNVINPLKETNVVDLFLKTYETEEKQNIESIYNPIYSEYVPLREPKSAAFDTYISSIQKLKQFDYDFYIVTRFDLWFGVPLNFNFNKFNFLFKEKSWWESHNLTTDTFYAFPNHMLDSFISACIECKNKSAEPGYLGLFHKLYTELNRYIDSNEMFFIDEEHTNVQISNKYKLSRNL